MSRDSDIEAVRREEVARDASASRLDVDALTEDELIELRSWSSLRFPHRRIRGPWGHAFEADLADVLVQHGD